MTRYIIRKYLSNNQKNGRKRAGILLGMMGIFFDLLLFTIKNIGGIISGSVAITADAYNNLADAGAHILALLAFPLGDQKPTQRFPFGLGRLEYLSGLVIAGAILIVGGRMAYSSVDKILSPGKVESSPLVILILVFSIAVKAYMYRYNKNIGERIDSAGLRSVAVDSICDCLATATIILSIVIQESTGFCVDGWTGLMVAGCILVAGIVAAKDSLTPLLGMRMDDHTTDVIYEIIESAGGVYSVEDIAVHDYGPNRRILTMRLIASPCGKSIDKIRHALKEKLGMEAVIEIDEILTQPNNCVQSRQE